MKSRSGNDASQANFLMPDLSSMLDQRQPLCRFARAIDWQGFEDSFGTFYEEGRGSPGKPIHLMAGLLILKQLHDLSDESVVEQWIQDPYFQHFTGELHFRWELPVDPSSLSRFRKRIGAQGCERVLKESIRLHGAKATEATVIADTTVQEKNVTYPTDSKLVRKISEKCAKIAGRHGVKLRRSYRRTIPKLMKAVHNRSNPKRAKNARKAERKFMTIAGRLVRELGRKLPAQALEEHAQVLSLFQRVLSQKRKDKNKVYSLHEPEVSCLSKGKERRKYEFGQKASVARTLNGGIVVGALSFPDSRHDSRTLPEVLEQVQSLTGERPTSCVVDRGYRGKKAAGETRILIPDKPVASDTAYQKSKKRKLFRKRAGIEPVIGHLKSDFRLGRNYLKGLVGAEINLLMAAAAFNFRKWMKNPTFLLRLFRIFSSKRAGLPSSAAA